MREMVACPTPPPGSMAAKATQSKTDAQLRKVILEERPVTVMARFDGAFEEA